MLSPHARLYPRVVAHDYTGRDLGVDLFRGEQLAGTQGFNCSPKLLVGCGAFDCDPIYLLIASAIDYRNLFLDRNAMPEAACGDAHYATVDFRNGLKSAVAALQSV
jgi:hypothetical protein